MPKQGFPTRKERRDLLKELHVLEQQLGQEFSSSALYQAYSEALNKLDQKMDQLYELGDMGLPPAVSAKDKEELLELLTNVGKTGEQFLGDAQRHEEVVFIHDLVGIKDRRGVEVGLFDVGCGAFGIQDADKVLDADGEVVYVG